MIVIPGWDLRNVMGMVEERGAKARPSLAWPGLREHGVLSFYLSSITYYHPGPEPGGKGRTKVVKRS